MSIKHLYIIVTLLVLSMSVFLLSRVWGYYHSGASSINVYKAGIEQLKNHNPPIQWLEDDIDIKGNINSHIREEIETSYCNAWGILNLSINEQQDLGLREHFSEKKVEQIRATLGHKTFIQRKDLDHNLQLHFISYDNQLVSFTDRNMILSQKIGIVNNSLTTLDTSDYNIVMTLNDGKWRINKIVRN